MRKGGLPWWPRPDGKTQVTAQYIKKADGSVEPKKIHTVVIATQHAEPLRATRCKKVSGDTCPGARSSMEASVLPVLQHLCEKLGLKSATVGRVISNLTMQKFKSPQDNLQSLLFAGALPLVAMHRIFADPGVDPFLEEVIRPAVSYKLIQFGSPVMVAQKAADSIYEENYSKLSDMLGGMLGCGFDDPMEVLQEMFSLLDLGDPMEVLVLPAVHNKLSSLNCPPTCWRTWEGTDFAEVEGLPAGDLERVPLPGP